MKKTFSSHSEVCHVWASQSQETGSAGNITFDKDTIYSYGYWPMARFIPNKNIVLIRNWPYSNSTAKHLNHVRRSIPDYYEKIYVYNPASGFSNENIKDMVSKIKESFEKFQTAQKYKKYYRDNEQSVRSELQKYCKLFKCEYPAKEIKKYSLNTEQANLQIEKQQERLDKLEAIREEKYQARLKEIEPIRQKALNAWLNGESNVVSDYDKILKQYIYISDTCRLRIKDNNVETTMRAKVSIREAKILWHRIKSGKDIKGHKIDYYTVISYNGELKIGCHNIEKSEVNRIGKLLDQIKDS